MIIKSYDGINSDIRDDVELTEDGFGFSAEPYGVTTMSDEVAALALLTRAIATALNMGVMNQEEVERVVTWVAKAAARRDR